MKKRILIFSIAYEPLLGGAELAVRNITDRLLNYEFDLITCRFSRKHKAQERIGNVNVYRVGFGSKIGRYLYPALAWRLARKLHKENSYQIVWSIMAAYAGAAALMMLRRYPLLNFVVTLQEGDPIVHIHRKVRGFKKMWQRIFGRADYITAISQYLADWARSEGATCPIEIVPNGVNPHLFSPLIRGRKRGGRNSKFTIITTSRLVPKNGIDILIKAIGVIARENVVAPFIRPGGFMGPDPEGVRLGGPYGAGKSGNYKSRDDVKLMIAGSGSEEGKLKELTRKLKLEDNIEFLGNVKPEKIPEYLASADIFVRPSRSEGLGSSFLEAMAAGLPVIGTPVGGIVDFLHPLPQSLPQGEGGKANGLFVKVDDPEDLAEKIKFLTDNPDLRIKLGQNGRRLIEEKYSWDKITQQMDRIFQKL